MFTLSLSKLSTAFGSLFRSTLLQDASLVFIANFGSAFTLFAASILLARVWGVTSFGILNSLFGLASLAVGLTDFGITITLIRLVSKFQTTDRARYQFLLSLVLIVEAALGLVIVAIALLGAPTIATQYLHVPAETGAVRWILLGAAGVSAAAYARVLFQAHRFYLANAGIALGDMAMRTAGMLVASIVWHTVEAVALAYCLASLVTLVAGSLVALRRFSPLPGLTYPLKSETLRQFFHFGKWVAITIILNTFLVRIDVVLITALSNPSQVAIYAVSFQISLGAAIAINSFNMILLPRAGVIRSRAELRHYMRQAISLSTLVGVGISVVFILAEPLVTLLYGSAFRDAVPILRIMLLGYLFFAYSYPFILLIYRLDRPDLVTRADAVHLFLLLIGDWLLIPIFGAIGSALLFLVLTVAAQSSVLLWLALRGRARAAEVGLMIGTRL